MYEPNLVAVDSVNAVRAPPLDVVAVRLWPPTALPLLSLTVAVIVALPLLETVVGAALTLTCAGAPALMVTTALPDAFRLRRCCGERYRSDCPAGGVGRAVGAVAVVGHCADRSNSRRANRDGLICHGTRSIHADCYGPGLRCVRSEHIRRNGNGNGRWNRCPA